MQVIVTASNCYSGFVHPLYWILNCNTVSNVYTIGESGEAAAQKEMRLLHHVQDFLGVELLWEVLK